MNENTHPFVVIMGGKKISDKTLIIEKKTIMYYYIINKGKDLYYAFIP